MKLSNQSRIFGFIIAGIMLISTALYYDASEKLSVQLNTYSNIGQLIYGIFELNIITTEHLTRKTQRTQSQWQNRHASLTNLLLLADKQLIEADHDILKRIRINLSNIRDLFIKIIVIENANFGNKKLINSLTRPLSSQARLTSQQIVSDANILGDRSLATLNKTAEFTSSLLQKTLIAIALILVAMMIWVRKSFLTPIIKLKRLSTKLIAGNYNSKLKLTGNNEVTDLSNSFNTLSSTISEKIEQLTENAKFLETSKKKLETSLLATQAAEHRYSSILHAAIDSIITIDENHLIQTINPATEKMFGYSKEEMIGKNVNLIVPYPHHKYHDQYLVNYHKTRKKNIIGIGRQVEGQRKDGSLFSIHLSIAEMNIDGKTYFSGTLRDITEEIEAKEMILENNRQLEITNQELESYAYSISHDLRSPLRSIDGFSMMLIEDHADNLDEDALNCLKRIRFNTEKMSILIKDLLKMSRVTQEAIDIESVDLVALAKDEIDQLKSEYPNQTIEFDSPLHIIVLADKALIQAVIENLLNNAVKYASTKSICKIEMGSVLQDNQLVYYIKDNGVGFNMDHKNKLFKPFQRLHKIDEFDGSGIGLATVHRIISRHLGSIWAEGEVNTGATFYFTLGTSNAVSDRENNTVTTTKTTLAQEA